MRFALYGDAPVVAHNRAKIEAALTAIPGGSVVFDFVATPAELQERAGRLWAALAAGVLPRPAPELFALDAAGQAHRRLESRESTGALVLVA